jgi:hypothetical protein
MKNNIKKHFIFLLESPLILIFSLLRIIVAFLTILYIRVIKKGIHQGHKLHTYIELHELGLSSKNKKRE